jgi:MOSC domain-containing protein YiiM
MSPVSLRELGARFAQQGELRWIGVRPAQGAAMTILERVELLAGRGLAGDRTALRGSGGKRQVTLFQFEHLAVLASLLGRERVLPELLRRNLAVSGINVLALRSRRFSIGGLTLEGTGYCAPCRRLEETLGCGGFNASRGHGGITARVIGEGSIQIGDSVAALPGSSDAEQRDEDDGDF